MDFSIEPVQALVDKSPKRYKLSDRESQVLGLAAQGKSDKEIGAELDCAYWTVRTECSTITTTRPHDLGDDFRDRTG